MGKEEKEFFAIRKRIEQQTKFFFTKYTCDSKIGILKSMQNYTVQAAHLHFFRCTTKYVMKFALFKVYFNRQLICVMIYIGL